MGDRDGGLLFDRGMYRSYAVLQAWTGFCQLILRGGLSASS